MCMLMLLVLFLPSGCQPGQLHYTIVSGMSRFAPLPLSGAGGLRWLVQSSQGGGEVIVEGLEMLEAFRAGEAKFTRL